MYIMYVYIKRPTAEQNILVQANGNTRLYSSFFCRLRFAFDSEIILWFCLPYTWNIIQ